MRRRNGSQKFANKNRRIYRRKKRQNYRQKRRRVPKNVTVPMYKSLNTVPERMTIKMRFSDYATSVQMNNNLNILRTFKTSLYYPQDGSGHQPMYFDQLMYNVVTGTGLYQKFIVWGIKYRFTLLNQNLNESTYFGVMHQDVIGAEVNPIGCRERGTGKWRVLGSVNGGYAKSTITGYMSTYKTLGRTKTEIVTNPNFSGTYANDPNLMAYLLVYIQSTNVGGGSYHLATDLTFYATLYDRYNVAPS